MTEEMDTIELVRRARDERELKQIRMVFGCDDCYGWDPDTCDVGNCPHLKEKCE